MALLGQATRWPQDMGRHGAGRSVALRGQGCHKGAVPMGPHPQGACGPQEEEAVEIGFHPM